MHHPGFTLQSLTTRHSPRSHPAVQHLRRWLAVPVIAVLAGCAATVPDTLVIDRSISSPNHSSRVQFVVLHYTVGDLSRSLNQFTRGEVSTHYLITDDEPARILQLVDENRSAWHAGISQWRGRTWLNASSIGIEIVNPGFKENPDGTLIWQPYSESQIRAVMLLLRDIMQRHGIKPENVVGHSDIAPTRKLDPGPLFPWKRLADAGLARWYDPAAFDAARARFAMFGLPDIAWFQQQLAKAGYEVPQHGELDDNTRKVLRAFQMRFRPLNIDGTPDVETAAILAALNQQ